MEALLRIFVSAPQYNPVLLDTTMNLYSLLADILTQDKDPADSVPTNDNVDTKPGCMIQWIKCRFFDDIPRWASFSAVYYIDLMDR